MSRVHEVHRGEGRQGDGQCHVLGLQFGMVSCHFASVGGEAAGDGKNYLHASFVTEIIIAISAFAKLPWRISTSPNPPHMSGTRRGSAEAKTTVLSRRPACEN